MPNPILDKIPRKVLPILYVIDTSGSMVGERIAAINVAMKQTVEILRDIDLENTYIQPKLGVLTFSSVVNWLTDGLGSMSDFFWKDLTAAGRTMMGQALGALHDKLSIKEFLISETGFLTPIIFFISDGTPTDDNVFGENLKLLRENRWFINAIKICIVIGDDVDKNYFTDISGDESLVIEVTGIGVLPDFIKMISERLAQFYAIRLPEGYSDVGNYVLDLVINQLDPEEKSLRRC